VRAQGRAQEPEFAEVCAAWQRVTGEDIGAGTPLWVNAFDDACRQVARYRQGRVLFAGDAAHRQMPIGGQALNLGLQDAVNLGWKLAAVARGRAPHTLLDSYHDERHAVGRRVLDNIRTQAQLLLGGAEAASLRALMGELLQQEDVRRHLAGMISGVDVRHDMGPGEHPLLGVRLPHARLAVGHEVRSGAELLRAGRGVLLTLHPAAAALHEEAAPWTDRVSAVAARCADGAQGALHGVDALLVRPDGHVAWVRPGSTASLREALTCWFGAPRPAPAAAEGRSPALSPAVFGE
ncbi:FAD-dependent monooxygenase, partial [Streptomyces sp. KL118A]|uniref:FAD-dependent monooxygenase n=1 Tax=Streptomyces sp. KL118A TaxID=3045153 RepID=UPI00278BC9A6